VILRAYFDDSGTHTNSEVTVMGGLIGTVEQWERFERHWAAKLERPLEGEPPLKMVHRTPVTRGPLNSKFQRYSNAEQDAVIHDFRQIIIDAQLTSVAMAVE
jgi:hypothetical protein